MSTQHGYTRPWRRFLCHPPGKTPRTGIYYLRRRVPARFSGVPGVPSGIVKWSLETKVSREARRHWPDALAKWAEMEAEWERKANMIEATDNVLPKIVSGWVAAVQADVIKIEADGWASDVFEPLDLPEIRNAASVARMVEVVERHADEACQIAGVTVTDDSRPRLINAMMRPVQGAYLEADLKSPAVNIARVTAPSLPLASNFLHRRTTPNRRALSCRCVTCSTPGKPSPR